MSDVIHNTADATPRQCSNHTHRRPIRPSALTIRLRVAQEIDRRHAWHFMSEAGCPKC